MPELPEVQTVLDTLESQIKGSRIDDIDIIYAPIITGDIDDFKKRLIGRRFCGFKRRGKYLLFEMDDITLVSHLRMEGKYFIMKEDVPLSKHDHLVFHLDDGRQLRYNDVRKFGRMELIPRQEDYDDFKDLGPEPFSDRFNEKYCREYLKKKKVPIKQVLLDQSFVAGIGNIYADEILHAIRVHPLSEADKLNDEDIKELIVQTRNILKQAIAAGGTTIRSYTSSLGVTGRFQLSLRIHTLKECSVCATPVKKIRVGGRGTYFCEKCQKVRS